MSILISLEGIDGSGKSSVAKYIYKNLKLYCGPNKLYKDVILTKESGGTNVGKKIRKLLQNSSSNLSKNAELFMFAADRAHHFETVVLPALDNNKIVISDRMVDSFTAYQGFARGFDIEIINNLNIYATKNRFPDIVIYIKISYETSLQRLKKRGNSKTRIEKENQDFFNKVINGYETIFHNKENVILINGESDLKSIKKEVFSKIVNKLKSSDMFFHE